MVKVRYTTGMKTTLPITPILFLLALGIIVALSGCASVPDEVPENLTAPELFQAAQEYADQGNYKAAHVYVDAVFTRFSEDPEQRLTAEYHRAHYHAKEGKTDLALQEFQAIIDEYEDQPGQNEADADQSGEQGALPSWILVLAQAKFQELQQTNE